MEDRPKKLRNGFDDPSLFSTQLWTEHGVFSSLWWEGLIEYDEGKKLNPACKVSIPHQSNLRLEVSAQTLRSKLGTKRSLIVDGAGIPISLYLDRANWNDNLLVEKTLGKYVLDFLLDSANYCGDKGYDSMETRIIVYSLGMNPHIRSRGEEIKEKKKNKQPKR